jgi:hypothetical protein
MIFRYFNHCIATVFLFGSLAIFTASNAMADDGGGSHGGGTGVACFDSVEMAQKVKAANGQIAPEIVPHIVKVTVTDQFEFEQKYGPFLPLYSGDRQIEYVGNDFKNPAVLAQSRSIFENPAQYLNRVIDEKIAVLSPGFAMLLKEALNEVAIQKWQNGPVTLLNDIDLATSLSLQTRLAESPQCALVPIVNRQSLPSQGLWPQVKITYNAFLFDHLLYENVDGGHHPYSFLNGDGGLGSAFLLLHEALYIMADKMGQKTSLLSRELAALLLSKSTYDSVKYEMAFMRLLYYAGFDRLDLFFDAEGSGATSLRDNTIKYPRYEFYRVIMQNILRIEKEGVSESYGPHYLRAQSPEIKEKTRQFFNSIEQNDLEAFMLIAWDIFTIIDPARWPAVKERMASIMNSKSRQGLFKEQHLNLESLKNNTPDFFSLIAPSRDDEFSVKFVCEAIGDFFAIDKLKENKDALEFYQLQIGAPLLVIGPPPLWEKAQRYCRSQGVD